MPIKPNKGESQSDWMARCTPEMMGKHGGTKRPQDQAVAACLTMWRAEHGGSPPDKQLEHADPGYRSDSKPRYALDSEAHIRAAWHAVNKSADAYTAEQTRRIKVRIVAAWKDKIDKDGPPSIEDKGAMDMLKREVVLTMKVNCPDPDDDEEHDAFIERCKDEVVGDNDDMDEDEAEEACQLHWDEQRSVGDIVHKTHATPASGLEFVMSDASPDRFGDVVETGGWRTEAFARNPICLFNHDKGFVVGRWDNVRIADNALRGDLVLAPKGTSPRIDEIRRLIEADILRAVSVGFRPLQYEPIKGDALGMRYLQHELVECSVVAVPANANALAVAKSLNITPATVRMVFGEHASNNTVRRSFNRPTGGEHAEEKPEIVTTKPAGEHAETHERHKGVPMLLSKRIQDGEKGLLGLQDQLDTHLTSIDDDNPTEEQMAVTEDLTAKIEMRQRNLNSLKAIEAKNGSDAKGNGADSGMATVVREGKPAYKVPAEFIRPKKKADPIDYYVRSLIVGAKSRTEGITIDEMRRKLYGDDEATRVMCEYVLKTASAPALTTVAGWAQELVQTTWAAFMDPLLPMSIFPKLQAMGTALSFGQTGRIIIPTRNLTPAIAGAFVGEGAPIPVRQGAFASQTLTPKKLAVITTFTREMSEHSIPAIEGLLRQAVLEDTAIALDTVLISTNTATTIAPAGLRSYQATLTASAATPGYNAFIADYRTLTNSLITLTNGNVRRPALLVNPQQVLFLETMQPPAAAAPLWPLAPQIEAGRVGRAALLESSTVPLGMAIMVDAADFTTAGAEGPRMELSDQATLHFEDTTPLDIVSGPGSAPVAASPVKSLWQTDSLGLRTIMMMNFIMRRPVVAWMTGTVWGA